MINSRRKQPKLAVPKRVSSHQSVAASYSTTNTAMNDEECESMAEELMATQDFDNVPLPKMLKLQSYLKGHIQTNLNDNNYNEAHFQITILESLTSQINKCTQKSEQFQTKAATSQPVQISNDPIVSSVDQESLTKEKELEYRQKATMERFEKYWQTEMPERYIQTSDKILDLLDEEDKCRDEGDEERADQIAAEINELKTEEEKENHERYTKDYQKAKNRLLKKFEEEKRKLRGNCRILRSRAQNRSRGMNNGEVCYISTPKLDKPENRKTFAATQPRGTRKAIVVRRSLPTKKSADGFILPPLTRKRPKPKPVVVEAEEPKYSEMATQISESDYKSNQNEEDEEKPIIFDTSEDDEDYQNDTNDLEEPNEIEQPSQDDNEDDDQQQEIAEDEGYNSVRNNESDKDDNEAEYNNNFDNDNTQPMDEHSDFEENENENDNNEEEQEKASVEEEATNEAKNIEETEKKEEEEKPQGILQNMGNQIVQGLFAASDDEDKKEVEEQPEAQQEEQAEAHTEEQTDEQAEGQTEEHQAEQDERQQPEQGEEQVNENETQTPEIKARSICPPCEEPETKMVEEAENNSTKETNENESPHLENADDETPKEQAEENNQGTNEEKENKKEEEQKEETEKNIEGEENKEEGEENKEAEEENKVEDNKADGGEEQKENEDEADMVPNEESEPPYEEDEHPEVNPDDTSDIPVVDFDEVKNDEDNT